MARALQANLTLVHAIPGVDRDLPVQLDLDELALSAESEATYHRIEELQRAVGSKGRVAVVIGPVQSGPVEAVGKLKADVLAIGRSPQLGSNGRMRDLTYAMVRDVPCPALSV